MMTVPKAAMNPNCDFVAWEYDVRASWKIFAMKAKTITERMKIFSNH